MDATGPERTQANEAMAKNGLELWVLRAVCWRNVRRSAAALWKPLCDPRLFRAFHQKHLHILIIAKIGLLDEVPLFIRKKLQTSLLAGGAQARPSVCAACVDDTSDGPRAPGSDVWFCFTYCHSDWCAVLLERSQLAWMNFCGVSLQQSNWCCGSGGTQTAQSCSGRPMTHQQHFRGAHRCKGDHTD